MVSMDSGARRPGFKHLICNGRAGQVAETLCVSLSSSVKWVHSGTPLEL